MSDDTLHLHVETFDGPVPLDQFTWSTATGPPAFEYPPPPVGADPTGGFIIAAVFALAAFTAAFLIARNATKKRKKATRDDTRQTITTRGEWIGSQMGTFRVAPLFAWVGEPGDRRYRPPRQQDKHNQARPAEYRDRGIHVLSLGPGKRLTHIMVGERVYWRGNLTRENFPSGGTVVVFNHGGGGFRLYWGDINQPVDPIMADRVGTATSWPGVMYVVWDKISLGETPQWQLLEYVIEVTPPAEVFEEFSWQVTAPDGRRGWNPAYVLHRLLTGPMGVGAEMKPRRIDRASLVEMGERCRDERLACDIRWTSGYRVDQAIADVLTDIGYAAIDGPVLSFKPLREDQPVHEWSNDALKGPAPERKSDNLGGRATNLIYEMISSDINYLTQDVPAPNDGSADESIGAETRPQIEITTNPAVATRIVERRSRQDLANKDPEVIEVGHDAVRMRPGDKYRFPGDYQRFVFGITPSPSGLTAKVEGPLDVFALRAAEVVDLDVLTPPENLPVAHDLSVRVRKGTNPEFPGVTYLEVFRIRAHEGITAARVQVAQAGTGSFQDVGQQDNWAAGGPLENELAAGPEEYEQGIPTTWQCGTYYGYDPGPIITGHNGTQGDTGLNARQIKALPTPPPGDTSGTLPGSTPCPDPPPIFPSTPDATVDDGDYTWQMVTRAGVFFEPLNDDQPWINQAIDDIGWFEGRQVAVINDEYFYVRSVDPQPLRDFPSGAAVVAGDAFEPTGQPTGYRYVAQNDGTLGSEPAIYPEVVGEQFTSGTVVMETRRLAYELRGLVRAREGTVRAVHPKGSMVYVIPRQNLTVLRDITIREGDSLLVKTVPATFAETAPAAGAVEYHISV